MSLLSSATIDTFVAYLILGTSIVLMQVKNPTESCSKVCYKHDYKMHVEYSLFLWSSISHSPMITTNVFKPL